MARKKILRMLILSQSRNSLIGNRPSARMQSTKDSRSVFSMVLKLLLKKVKFLIQYLETMKVLIFLFVTMKMKKYLKYWKYWKYCMRTMKSIKRMKNMTLMRTIMIMNLTNTVKMRYLLKTMKLKKEIKR